MVLVTVGMTRPHRPNGAPHVRQDARPRPRPRRRLAQLHRQPVRRPAARRLAARAELHVGAQRPDQHQRLLTHGPVLPRGRVSWPASRRAADLFVLQSPRELVCRLPVENKNVTWPTIGRRRITALLSHPSLYLTK